MQPSTQPTPEDYGIDRYAYVEGVRCRIGTLRTIRPAEGETNGGFQARIDQLARELFQRHGALSVATDFERSAGGITQCVVDIAYAPKPEPEIAPDNRPAGGRVVPFRGGQRRHG